MRKGSTRRPQDDSPAVHVKNYITPGGLERLKEEHQFLLNKDRPAVAEVVACVVFPLPVENGLRWAVLFLYP